VSGTTGTRLIADRPSTSMAVLNATGVDPAGIAQVLKLQLLGGAWSGFRPGAIAVSQVVAQDKGWQVGQQVDFLLPDGTPQTSTVAAEFAGTLGVADVLVPSTELLPHLLEPYANAVYVKLAPGADAEAVAAQLRQAAPGTVVLTRSQHLAAVAQQSSGDNWIIDLVVVLLAGYAGIAAVNVLVGSTMARRREFALFRLGGADPAQVVRSVLVEVLFVVATAVIVGSMVGLAVIVGYGYLLTGDVWLPFLPSTYTGIVLAAVLVGVVGAVAPARVAAKSTPAQAG
jgi:putative ABC transport system permease protein